VVWSIKQFNGSQEYLMRAHFGLPSISAEDAREWKAPIQVRYGTVLEDAWYWYPRESWVFVRVYSVLL